MREDIKSKRAADGGVKVNKKEKILKRLRVFVAVIMALFILSVAPLSIVVTQFNLNNAKVKDAIYSFEYKLLGLSDKRPNDTSPIISKSNYADEKVEVYFPDLKNYKNGDCSLVKVGDTEVLIDAGPNTDALEDITDFLSRICTDGKIEYVIVTHAHIDHYSCFATSGGIFSRFEIGTVIDFAQVTPTYDENGKNIRKNTKRYKKYQKELSAAVSRGTKHYTAKEARESGNYEFKLSDTVTLKILDNKYYYEPDYVNLNTENNHSVCAMIKQKCTDGSYRNFLFTGDLQAEGEEYLVNNGELENVVLLKAPHHGSITSSTPEFLAAVKPEIVCICCNMGGIKDEELHNSFPTQTFIDRVSNYTARIYAPTTVLEHDDGSTIPYNGTITVTSYKNIVRVKGDNHSRPILESEWFKSNRKLPPDWKYMKAA